MFSAQRRSRRGFTALVTALLLGLISVVGLPSAAQADVIDNAITSIKLTTTGDVWDGERIQFSCTWSVPVGSQPGDTFTMQLPDELRWQGATTFPLMAPDGVTPVAQGVVSATGSVTFTLTDYMLDHSSASGTCAFTTLYQATGPGDHDLIFDVGTGVITIPVTEGERCQVDCGVRRATKRGWLVDGGTKLQFVILAPATSSDATTVKFTDNPSPGYDLDCGTLTSSVAATTDDGGSLTAPFAGRYDARTSPPYATGQSLAAPAITCSATGLTVTWTGVPIDMYSEVRIRADVTDPTLKEYTNTGVVTMNGRDQSDGVIIKNPTPTGDGAGPAIHLEKWSTDDGGPATTDGSDFPGDYDTAPGADLVVGEPTAITFTITNTGDEDLVDVQVTDATMDGPAITGISCDFSALGGPATGTTWAEGPFKPGDSFTCTGTVPAMAADDLHADEATVTGVGTATGTTVTSHDQWHGHTPPKLQPRLSTTTSKAVAKPGVTLRDAVTGRGFASSYTGAGAATLYGPFTSRGASRCTAAHAVGTVAFAPRNGTVRTPGIMITEPGHYTWVASTTADERHLAATHRCGMASESSLVRKTPLPRAPNVDSGFSGTRRGRWHGRPG